MAPATGATARTPDAGQRDRGADGFRPRPGQIGKDVIWLPTPDAMVSRMLRMADVKPADTLVDLGSGDGRIAIAAARDFGAQSMGIEFDPRMVELSRRRAQQAGVAGRARFEQADIFEADFSAASVVTMYLLPALNLRLRPILFRMKPGTRVVSYSFDMGAWEPDETSRLGAARSFLWRIPANVDGRWVLDQGRGRVARAGQLRFEQRFQRIGGEALFGNLGAGLRDARLDGDRIAFAVRDDRDHILRYAGRVDGDRIAGEVADDDGPPSAFRATRLGAVAERTETVAAPEEEHEALRIIGE
ncbi:MAG: methyltransferase domain-containing protein [Burkholderiales bacterium]|nr:MAG: methyltransferase domain-containing protein [Burkholderiales bacterium]